MIIIPSSYQFGLITTPSIISAAQKIKDKIASRKASYRIGEVINPNYTDNEVDATFNDIEPAITTLFGTGLDHSEIMDQFIPVL